MPKYNNFWDNHTDKAFHFCAGGLIYFACIFLLNLLTRIGFLPLWMVDPLWKEVLSLSTVFVAGFVKEAWDMVKALDYRKFDWYDILFTNLGGVVTFAIYFVMGKFN